MTVRSAVVFAAGRGSRLGSLTENTPKPLLEVAGRTLLNRVLSGIAEAGVTRVTLVIGYRSEQIIRAIGPIFQRMDIRLVHQGTLDGTGRALLLTRRNLGREPFLFAWGDVLVGPEVYADVAAASAGGAGVLAVNEVDDPFAGAAVYVDDQMQITKIVEKPAHGTSTTRWNNSGIGVLPPSIWPEVEKLQPSDRGEYELPRAIGALVDAGQPFLAVPVTGPWFDIGTLESLEAARRAFETVPPALRRTAG